LLDGFQFSYRSSILPVLSCRFCSMEPFNEGCDMPEVDTSSTTPSDDKFVVSNRGNEAQDNLVFYSMS
jgi:hypothetical protein